MSSTVESKNITVGKPAKEKKVKVPKEKKARSAKTASHPPYFQMIKEALLALNEKNGSSPHAIGKYMEDKHKAVLPDNFRKMLSLQLKNSASKGKLTKVKASYKLCEDGNKPKKTKKPTTTAARATATVVATGGGRKKGVAAKATKENKKMTPKKKKVTPAKRKMTPGKAKQPKSIKSPVSKRARKASV
ncbi:hypothetical protein M8C21_013197 [Ambrosia artemisiifolia]|uniref:H15 domain-containing protein n=1 Tax=Ambrosia artemisiifolia TaxID=4212 RepID=A0AAD5D0H4_AMBAR|nr:hypothetical protein M8C21_013197 [Ambrosia artemisiifolia]